MSHVPTELVIKVRHCGTDDRNERWLEDLWEVEIEWSEVFRRSGYSWAIDGDALRDAAQTAVILASSRDNVARLEHTPDSEQPRVAECTQVRAGLARVVVYVPTPKKATP